MRDTDRNLSESERALIAPVAPNDDLPFEHLAREYNFRRTSNRAGVLTRLLIQEFEKRTRPIRVLDIGCGEGFDRNQGFQWVLRRLADEYWGVEPDEQIEPPPGLFDRHITAPMEKAELPPESIDVAYSYQVMEHVADPLGFMDALQRSLKRGGVYLFITPNRRHYFARIASTLNSLKLSDMVLHLVRGEEADHYHHPLQYRFNDEERIKRTCAKLGFLEPEFTYLEQIGPYPYFPVPFRPIFHALAFKRRLVQNRRSLLDLLCRITKKP